MIRYFDRTFFKFLLGFVIIIAVSFIVVITANYLGISSDPELQQAQNIQQIRVQTDVSVDK